MSSNPCEDFLCSFVNIRLPRYNTGAIATATTSMGRPSQGYVWCIHTNAGITCQKFILPFISLVTGVVLKGDLIVSCLLDKDYGVKAGDEERNVCMMVLPVIQWQWLTMLATTEDEESGSSRTAICRQRMAACTAVSRYDGRMELLLEELEVLAELW